MTWKGIDCSHCWWFIVVIPHIYPLLVPMIVLLLIRSTGDVILFDSVLGRWPVLMPVPYGDGGGGPDVPAYRQRCWRSWWRYCCCWWCWFVDGIRSLPGWLRWLRWFHSRWRCWPCCPVTWNSVRFPDLLPIVVTTLFPQCPFYSTTTWWFTLHILPPTLNFPIPCIWPYIVDSIPRYNSVTVVNFFDLGVDAEGCSFVVLRLRCCLIRRFVDIPVTIPLLMTAVITPGPGGLLPTIPTLLFDWFGGRLLFRLLHTTIHLPGVVLTRCCCCYVIRSHGVIVVDSCWWVVRLLFIVRVVTIPVLTFIPVGIYGDSYGDGDPCSDVMPDLIVVVDWFHVTLLWRILTCSDIVDCLAKIVLLLRLLLMIPHHTTHRLHTHTPRYTHTHYYTHGLPHTSPCICLHPLYVCYIFHAYLRLSLLPTRLHGRWSLPGDYRWFTLIHLCGYHPPVSVGSFRADVVRLCHHVDFVFTTRYGCYLGYHVERYVWFGLIRFIWFFTFVVVTITTIRLSLPLFVGITFVAVADSSRSTLRSFRPVTLRLGHWHCWLLTLIPHSMLFLTPFIVIPHSDTVIPWLLLIPLLLTLQWELPLHLFSDWYWHWWHWFGDCDGIVDVACGGDCYWCCWLCC